MAARAKKVLWHMEYWVYEVGQSQVQAAEQSDYRLETPKLPTRVRWLAARRCAGEFGRVTEVLEPGYTQACRHVRCVEIHSLTLKALLSPAQVKALAATTLLAR